MILSLTRYKTSRRFHRHHFYKGSRKLAKTNWVMINRYFYRTIKA